MKNIEVLMMRESLSKINNRKNTKFSYLILRNKKAIKDTVDALREVQLQKIEGQDAFDKDRMELCRKFSKKDEKGNPRFIQIPSISAKSFDIENIEQFNLEMAELLAAERHAGYRENLERKTKEFDGLLACDAVGIGCFAKIALTDLPNDLTVEELEVIEQFIEET